MRHDGRFLVMHYGPMIGYRGSTRKRLTVAHRAYTLDAALMWLSRRDRRPGTPHHWFVAEAGKPATRAA